MNRKWTMTAHGVARINIYPVFAGDNLHGDGEVRTDLCVVGAVTVGTNDFVSQRMYFGGSIDECLAFYEKLPVKAEQNNLREMLEWHRDVVQRIHGDAATDESDHYAKVYADMVCNVEMNRMYAAAVEIGERVMSIYTVVAKFKRGLRLVQHFTTDG